MKKLQKLMIVIGSIIMFLSGFKAAIATWETIDYLRVWAKIAPTLDNKIPYLWRLQSFREAVLYWSVIITIMGLLWIGYWIFKEEEPSKLKYSRNYEYYR